MMYLVSLIFRIIGLKGPFNTVSFAFLNVDPSPRLFSRDLGVARQDFF